MTSKDNQKVFFGDEKVEKKAKTKGVNKIFSQVADNYDLMNDLMSFGLHRVWKKQFVKNSNIKDKSKILDLASGTGDIAKLIYEHSPSSNIWLVDQNKEMILKAKERAADEGFINKSKFEISEAESLPFKDNFFDHVFISFGFRNFSDKEMSLKEIFRILKKGGSLRILEFSKVNNKAFSKLYDFYSYKIIPTIGELVSDDKKSYEYLVKSIRTHENQKELKSMLKKNKFSKVSFEDLTNGIVCIHSGTK